VAAALEALEDVLDVAATEDCAAGDVAEELQPAATQYAYPILRCVSIGRVLRIARDALTGCCCKRVHSQQGSKT